MAWYGSGGWDYYPPYISVGQKKARGMLTLAKLLKKSKRTAEPVVLAHRKRQLAATFWGQAWADNLERYADLANRLPRVPEERFRAGPGDRARTSGGLRGRHRAVPGDDRNGAAREDALAARRHA